MMTKFQFFSNWMNSRGNFKILLQCISLQNVVCKSKTVFGRYQTRALTKTSKIKVYKKKKKKTVCFDFSE